MKTNTSDAYDPRWFVWTIVFLIATGMALVAYITISASNDSSSYAELPMHATRTQAAK